MNIREWFGFNGTYNESLEINICVDGLLNLYAKALMEYFSVQVSNVNELIFIDPTGLSKEQTLFLEWIKDKGIPYLQTIVSTDLPQDEQLVAKIEFDKYILEEEMDFEYPSEVRSSLIGIVNDLPQYINAANEVSSTIIKREINTLWSGWLYELFTDDEEPVVSVTKSYKLEGLYKGMSNYKESAPMAGSLFLF
ncbi:hypothetical protein FZC84_11830 [Rossellomorea vietnamensis]|uniref:Uncharacterized protein n=1 Tax=Rossellomorea vietnamensis TaxID=218284 RepID=A0A5D4MAS6_9BACI|nr:hypothetical protein [Rossellomorea vietnamensis]TYR99059.1 hypothetical protein FZC84_11830 [Rossellomorea vietnamensis]